MKVQNLAELRRHALATGAELEVDGRRFNAGQERIAPAPRPKPAAEAPEPMAPEPAQAEPTPDSVSREDVAAMLQAQADGFRQHIDAVTRAFAAALGAMPKTAEGRPPHPWKFSVRYDRNGAISEITATPVEG